MDSKGKLHFNTSESRSKYEGALIAIMGPTGVGKSSLIYALTGNEDIIINDGILSQTDEVASYECELHGKKFSLLDTPGFNESGGVKHNGEERKLQSDADVLEEIATFLAQSFKEGKKLNGIIYLHQISQPRFDGASVKNFRYFKKLCGEAFYSRVGLMTTRWDQVANEIGKAEIREKELKGVSVFGQLIENGAIYSRFQDRKDVENMIIHLLNVPGTAQITKIVDDMAVKKLKFKDTDVAVDIGRELIAAQKKHELEIKKLKEDMATETDAKIKKSMNEEAKKLVAEREANKIEFDKLNKTLEDALKSLEQQHKINMINRGLGGMNLNATKGSPHNRTSESREILTGPRGGKYYINSRGNKTYIRQ